MSNTGKNLGTIFNNDCNNILAAMAGKKSTPADYRRVVEILLDRKPGVFAQDVGLPDPVLFRTKTGTTLSKYIYEVSRQVWPKESEDIPIRQRDLLDIMYRAGTDPLQLTIDACRERNIPVLASFRMNAEDWYDKTYLLSDFGRAHPEWRLRKPSGELAGNLDPAVPEVYAHRMNMFTEVSADYDIDGIEFDFRRWNHMISDPLSNHPILTRLVRDTRNMLNETAKRKGRSKMLLGARVGPSLDSEPNPFLFPGIYYPDKPTNASCKELGLDVKTWIAEGLVDYLCPSLFLPSLPGMPLTKEFVNLAKGTEVGIYPTLWPKTAWMHGVCERQINFEKDQRPLALYKYDLCMTALRMYEDGADGISTFNWYSHLRDANVPNLWTAGEDDSGPAAEAVQTYIYPLLADPEKIRWYLAQPWALPPH